MVLGRSSDMGSQVLTVSDVMICPHGGSVTAVSSQSRVSAGGAAVLRPGDTFTIAGCVFNISGSPHPCVTVEWQNPSARASAVSARVLTTSSIGLCKSGDQAMQGVVS